MMAGKNASLVKDEDYVKYMDRQFHPLNYGDSFDLGGITLEIVNGTGHTKGSVCILIKEERTMLLGDACNTFTFMFSEESSTIEEYLEALNELKKMSHTFDRVYLSHGLGDAPKSILDEVIETCVDIMTGKVENQEFQFMGSTAYIAHEIEAPGQRSDGKLGNIVYNKEKVYKK
jgi:glyoxylase-like metal-dependent hydrolase (beta-lactamase superfamily II)